MSTVSILLDDKRRLLKWLRRLAMLLVLIGIIVCIVLLLNMTASNPTGRRYSSAAPATTGLSQDIGQEGERILSKDLGRTRNEDPGQRQCLCGPAAPADSTTCNACVLTLTTIATYRIPDFISSDYIAEAKNRKSLPLSDRELWSQLSDYAEAAKALDVPLWVFVRKDSEVDAEYYDLVEATGGGIVRYFTIPGYEDPTDRDAERGLAGCGAVFAVLGIPEVIPARRRTPKTRRKPSAVENAEEFAVVVRSRAQSRIDKLNADEENRFRRE